MISTANEAGPTKKNNEGDMMFFSPKKLAASGLVAATLWSIAANAEVMTESFKSKKWTTGIVIFSDPMLIEAYSSRATYRASTKDGPYRLDYDVLGEDCGSYMVSINTPSSVKQAKSDTHGSELATVSFDSGVEGDVAATYATLKGETGFKMFLNGGELAKFDVLLREKNWVAVTAPILGKPNKTLNYRFSLAGSSAAIAKANAACKAVKR